MSSNSSHDSAHLSPAAVLLPLDLQCLLKAPNPFIFAAYAAAVTLLLPLFAYILHHGVRQWRGRSSAPSSSSSSSSMSHSDVFTYHMVAMELVGVFGALLCCGAIFRRNLVALLVGGVTLYFIWCGQVLFHVLTCAERHLAAVHPVAYRRLRGGRGGARLRDAAAAAVWLLSVAWIIQAQSRSLVYTVFIFLGCSLAAVSFWSLSVLHVLIRPGPGGRGRKVWRVDRSKRRAFYTMAEILTVLLLRFVGNTVWFVLYTFGGGECGVTTAWLNWMNLPSSLVLPALYLQRAGMLPRCK